VAALVGLDVGTTGVKAVAISLTSSNRPLPQTTLCRCFSSSNAIRARV
jgi:sugar (pentulose or hexulose) kinase